MHHEKYYLIRPTLEFIERMMKFDQDGLAGIFLDAALWSWGFGDHMPGPDVRLEWIKLVFIGWIIAEYGSNAEFSEILGQVEISAAQFDQCWTVEEYGLDQTVEWALKELNTELFDRFVSTGNPQIDAWISFYEEKSAKS